MGKPKYAANCDLNQNEIVKALRKLGVSVELGHDDFLIGYNGKTLWYELKSDSAVSKKTGLVLESKKKASQKRLESEWKGHYRIVSSLDEILIDMEAI